MPEYDETNRGKLWPNRRKERETQPDMTGYFNIDGEEYFLDAWIKRDENGGLRMINLRKGNPKRKKETPPPNELDDEIPF